MTDAEVITSPANPLVKRVRSLTGERRRGPFFYCEGVQPVWRALEAGADIEVALVSDGLLSGSPAARLVEQLADARVPLACLSASLFGRLSKRDGPTGVAAIVREPRIELDDLVVLPHSVFVVLDRVANPGNLGSIVRTADAAGTAGVVLTGRTADPFSHVAVKASMGSIFSVPVVKGRSSDELFAWAEAKGIAVATTSAHATQSVFDVELPRPLALVFGSEGSGLGPELLARGRHQLRIPMVGTASSLNLSVSVGIVLFECQRGAVTRPAAESAP